MYRVRSRMISEHYKFLVLHNDVSIEEHGALRQFQNLVDSEKIITCCGEQQYQKTFQKPIK